MTLKSMIVWASGLIEFIDRDLEPDGAVLICTVSDRPALDYLLGLVSGDIVLRDFGGRIAPSIPEIGDDMQQWKAMDRLIAWEDCLRFNVDQVAADLAPQIVWTRK